jgi:hypothetical protein
VCDVVFSSAALFSVIGTFNDCQPLKGSWKIKKRHMYLPPTSDIHQTSTSVSLGLAGVADLKILPIRASHSAWAMNTKLQGQAGEKECPS